MDDFFLYAANIKVSTGIDISDEDAEKAIDSIEQRIEAIQEIIRRELELEYNRPFTVEVVQ